MKIRRAFIVDLACVVLLIAFCLALGLPRYRAGIDWGDEGFLAYGAVRVMDGQMPNRDFVSLQPPLSFYVLAAFFKTFGTSLAVLRTFGLVLHILVTLLIFAIGRLIMPAGFALAAAIPAVVLGLPTSNFVPFAVWQGIGFGLSALFFYLYALFHGRPWLSIFAGILTAAAVLSRHDQSVYFILTILTLTAAAKFAGMNWRKVFVSWFVVLAAALFCFLVICWWRGALPDMFRQLVEFPFTTYRKTSSSAFPHFESQAALQTNALTLLFFLPPIAATFGAGWLALRVWKKQFATNETIVAFLVVWCALFYCQVLTRSDIHHLLITLPPFFLFSAYAWWALHEKIRTLFARETNRRRIRTIQTLMAVLVAAAATCFLKLISYSALPSLQRDNETLALPRGGIRIEHGQYIAEFVRGVQDYVPNNGSILSLPYQPMLYFLCERPNPTRWNYLWPGDQTKQDHLQLIDEAKRARPAVVFMTGEREVADYASLIVDYVHAEYRHAGDIGRFAIYFPTDAN